MVMLLLACGCARSGSSSSEHRAAAPAPEGSGRDAATQPGAHRAETEAAVAAAAAPAARIAVRGGGRHAVRAEHGLVTSVEPQATRVGVGILQRGGNAVDAAVAVAYALAVTHPSAGNVGGGGFMLVRPAHGETVAIDFRETAPAALTRDKFDAMIAAGATGPTAVGVPGAVAGLHLAHSRYGRLPWAELVAPAVELARRGHRVGHREALTIQWNWQSLSRNPAARVIFGAGGKPRPAGSWLVRADLAKTLERIKNQGREGFYQGPTARALVAAVRPSGMTLADLKEYHAKLRVPLRFRYRGLQVEAMPPPSAGGVALAQTLLMLERLGAHRQPAGTAEELHLFLEASRRAQAVRRFEIVDPDALSAAEQSRRAALWTNPGWLLSREPRIDPRRATPSARVHPLHAAALEELEHTTHFAVIDRAGGVVSCTVTLSAGFGAKLMAPGTGVVLNNALAAFGTAGENLPAPRRRSTSSMAPTLVLQEGRPVLVLGSPGGDTIPSTVGQVLRNVIDHGMTIDAAVEAPRVHHGFVPDEFRYERQRPIPRSVLARLRALGHRVSHKRIPIGDANSILIADGAAWGYADRREGGLAMAAAAPE
jgi:gamma-glutamyltranspeptidase/glutathione hydrolase